jgi:hypothetical protein
VLADADPTDKAEVYSELGITLLTSLTSEKWLLKHARHSVCNRVCRRGDYVLENTDLAGSCVVVRGVGSIGVPLPYHPVTPR